MNAVEIEEAISALAEQPFDAAEFPFSFLEAFGNKAATIARLRGSSTNKSDIGGVLQPGHIHPQGACAPRPADRADQLRRDFQRYSSSWRSGGFEMKPSSDIASRSQKPTSSFEESEIG